MASLNSVACHLVGLVILALAMVARAEHHSPGQQHINQQMNVQDHA